MSDGQEDREADVEIAGWARVGSLRFRREPKTAAELEGESETVTARRHLPEEVRAGETYRDVEVIWRGRAWSRVARPDPGDRRRS